jgi:1,4-dihydroxy-6-naphthoate synthase
MFYGLACGKVDTGGLEVAHVMGDIESLNRAAREGRHEVTALSFHAYPYVAHAYALMPCGGSIGDGYGPLVVAREPIDPASIGERLVAVPGMLTTAYLALKLCAPGTRTRVVPFDRVMDEVASGRADLGLVIHEGQLTYGGQGLRKVLDLGAWWKEETGLPLPLGGNAVRRDLGPDMMARLTRAGARDGPLLARAPARGPGLCDDLRPRMPAEIADRFVGMWVNEMTLDCGERGRRAIQVLLDRGHEAGIIPDKVRVDFVEA